MTQQNAQDLLLQLIRDLLSENQLDKAIEVLIDLNKKTQANFLNDVTSVTGGYRGAVQEYRIKQNISYEEFRRYENQSRNALLEIMGNVERKVRMDSKYRGLDSYQFEVPTNYVLEKIIGDTSNLLKINWLEKALLAAKSVCRVVNGANLGTGFITKDGYLFTNNHVIKSAEEAATTRVEFNYRMNAAGQIEQRSAYQLDASTFISSPPDQLDFARVKIIDNPSDPLSQWGYAEIDPTAIPINGEPATIIQHPKGQDMQIALNSNDVVSVWNQYLFYKADTEPGSSGSPVFNRDWKVVALHHAGKTYAEGGIQINAKGDKVGANRGILFGHIFDFIKNGGHPVGNTGGQESFTTAPEPQPVPQPVVTTETSEKPVVADQQHEPVKPVVTEPVIKPQPTPAPSPAFVNSPPKIVMVYDLQDEPRAAQLNKHLTVLKLTKKISVYNVQKVAAGEDVIASADREIASADFVFTLISSNLFNEDALWLIKSLEAVTTGKKVIPVLLDKTDIDGTGLEKLRSLPTLNRTVTDFPNPEAAYSDIVEEIKRLINK